MQKKNISMHASNLKWNARSDFGFTVWCSKWISNETKKKMKTEIKKNNNNKSNVKYRHIYLIAFSIKYLMKLTKKKWKKIIITQKFYFDGAEITQFQRWILLNRYI